MIRYKSCFDIKRERYLQKTVFGQNGGHFGRHLGFWEMYVDLGVSLTLFLKGVIIYTQQFNHGWLCTFWDKHINTPIDSWLTFQKTVI